MKSILESKCKFTLTSCMVSWLGLASLTAQCSLLGIALTVVGLIGIGWGSLGIIRALGHIVSTSKATGAGLTRPLSLEGSA